ncbi:MAG: helix-turn-helix domain-containing protein, partial [Pseudomonadota bacterium]
YADVAKSDTKMLDCLSEALCIELARRFADVGDNALSCRAFSVEKERIVHAMMQLAIRGQANLADIAEAIGEPPYRLTRTFKKHYGETPREQMFRLRLERVRGLLSETITPLPEIAYDCGYSSQSHITTAFRKHFGVSPARYRLLTHSE